MSLVNDALQKVHAQTTQRQAAAAPGAPGAVPYRFHKPQQMSSRAGWFVGGAVVVVGLAAAMVVAVMHRTPQTPATPIVTATPAPVSVPMISQSPTTQPVATAVPPPPPAQPNAPAPAASGLAPSTVPLPINAAAPTTQPTPQSVAVPPEAASAVVTIAPPTTAPATPASATVPVPAAPVTAVIDLQSLNVPGLGKLKLTGIALSPFGTRAVINNTILSVGDTVGPATITDIQDKRVKLEIGGKTFTLTLP